MLAVSQEDRQGFEVINEQKKMRMRMRMVVVEHECKWGTVWRENQ
jgi:hypothetical protein